MISHNARNRIDGLKLLASLDSGASRLVFFDPQHREVLDKQAYGNEGERQRARAQLPQMDLRTIQRFMIEIERVLKPSGYLALWVDKYLMASGKWQRWVTDIGVFLSPVDMLAWKKGRIGMGRRFRCETEYLLMLQKPSVRALWSDHSISDCCLEPHDRKRHPHAKPIELTKRIIMATTKRGDLVVDPAAGGYGVLDACLITGREFIGGDLR